MRFNKENVSKVKNESGVYDLYGEDCHGPPIYVGVSHMLKHRLESYYEKDDGNAHPTKRRLRGEIKSFTYRYVPFEEAQHIEHMQKHFTKFNYL